MLIWPKTNLAVRNRDKVEIFILFFFSEVIWHHQFPKTLLALFIYKVHLINIIYIIIVARNVQKSVSNEKICKKIQA